MILEGCMGNNNNLAKTGKTAIKTFETFSGKTARPYSWTLPPIMSDIRNKKKRNATYYQKNMWSFDIQNNRQIVQS